MLRERAKTWVASISGLALLAVLLGLAGLTLWMVRKPSRSTNVAVRITSTGYHAFPNWHWLESVEVRNDNEELELTLIEREADVSGKSVWWLPTMREGQMRRSLITRVPVEGPWEIVVHDKERMVTYTTGTYEFQYVHPAGQGSITRDNRGCKAENAEPMEQDKSR